MSPRFGVLPLARNTFDVPFAEETARAAFAALDAAGIATAGPRELLFDADAAAAALDDLQAEAASLDLILLLQVTFTDATMTVHIAERLGRPMAMWAFPEPRLGGRLRLNALCGLNLAAHALGQRDVPLAWLWARPDAADIQDRLRDLAPLPTLPPSAAEAPTSRGARHAALDALADAKITVFGEHPAGFDTCEFDAERLRALTGTTVETHPISHLLQGAAAVGEPDVTEARQQASYITGLDQVDQTQLNRSLRVFKALEQAKRTSGASALAVRCWPETFTEYGCAACGPMAMMNEQGVPSACEADVYGAVSALLLQALAEEPVWMADLVDLDFNDDTGVFWHCGLAPRSMCAPDHEVQAALHSNRKMPLLHQFPLKAGAITVARLSQARGETKLVIGRAEVLAKPMAFTGTSGVFRFAQHARTVWQRVMDEGLEHHYAIAYGDHSSALREVAGQLGVPALTLC